MVPSSSILIELHSSKISSLIFNLPNESNDFKLYELVKSNVFKYTKLDKSGNSLNSFSPKHNVSKLLREFASNLNSSTPLFEEHRLDLFNELLEISKYFSFDKAFNLEISAPTKFEFSKINVFKFPNSTTLSKLTIPDTNEAVKDSTKSFKDSAGKTYYITKDTVILNQNAGKLEVVDGWSTLVSNANEAENMLRNTSPLAVYSTNTRIVKYLIINDDGTNYQATQDKYGVITDISVGTNDNNNKVWQVTVFTDGQELTYEVADVNTDISTVLFGEEGDLVRYDIKNNKFVQTASTDVKIDMSAFLDDSEYDGFIADGVSDREQLIVDEVLGNLIVFKKVDGDAIDPISISDDAVVYDLSNPDAPAMGSVNDLEGRMIMFLNTEGDTSEYEMIIILD